MTFLYRLQPLVFLILLAFSPIRSFSQCFQIETILVDACDDSGDEGFNEMVRFKINGTAVNTAGMIVNWPSQAWQGLVQNATTTSKVATLNAQITALGGCGQLIQPIAGVIPANAEVILITSPNFSLTANAFGALTQNVYILFQDNTTVTGGHFGNYNPVSGIRTLTISFGACSDTVSYDRSLLVDLMGAPGAANGAAVFFTPSGVATYGNSGCVAPIDVFSVDAGTPLNACPGATISLSGTAQGQTSIAWTAPTGTFVNSSNLATNFTLPLSASGTITLTLTVTNSCGNSISDIVLVNVNAATTPAFSAISPICSGDLLLPFPTTSLNGITGLWSPAPNNLLTTTYTFNPTAGQCATNFQMQVVVNISIIPDFLSAITLCTGNSAPILNNVSPNGVVGTWSPAVINNIISGSYTFTPSAGQCSAGFTTNVTVTNSTIVPDFPTTITLCSGSIAPLLNTTSPNGISGVWFPTTINNTTNGTYTFTPNAGQCATSLVTNVTVTSTTIIPNFASTLSICSGTVTPLLNSTSPNGIIGVWLPLTIDNTTNGTYVFTPNPGQCATNITTTVTVTSANILPSFAATLSICSGTVAPLLNSTSPNGIIGFWLPLTIDNTTNGTYVFTPNPGQCATNFTTTVTVTSPNIIPNFTTTLSLCSGSLAPVLNTTSPNGIIGNWSPSTINNTTNGTYTFTPNTGQCATSIVLTVTITPPNVTPIFNAFNPICSGDNLSPIATTSNNGITGTWSPSFDNSVTKLYTFLPNPGQCANTISMTLLVTPKTTPDFITNMNFCSGSVVPVLNTTSPNGISGTWSPTTLNNLVSDTYTFLPNSGQCANPVVLTVIISNNQSLTSEYFVCLDPLGNALFPVRIDSGLSPVDYNFTWTKAGNPIAVTDYYYDTSEVNVYQIIATNKVTGCITIIDVNVIAIPPATAYAYVNEDFGDQQQIIVIVTGGLGNFEYQLNYGPFQQSNIFNISKGGEYTIHVRDINGCNSFELNVTAINYPKFFTPNDDSYHDTWNVDGLQSFQKGSISIFDRYGKLLKQITPTGEGWDGIYNGNLLPSDDYWFVIFYQSFSGETKTFMSHFSLKR